MSKRPSRPASGHATSDPIGTGEGGAVLVAIIIGITVVATLGTAMTMFYTSSTVSQTGSADFVRAYYLAEAGGRYAIKRIVDLEYGGGAPPSDTERANLVNALDGQTFSLADGTSFAIGLTYNDYLYTLTSTGNASAAASRSIMYEINVYRPPGGASGTPIPFTTAPGSNQLDPDDWNTVGTHTVADDKLTMKGADPVSASFDWNNSNSSLPDLLDVWQHSDELLTYEIQVKIKMNTNDLVAGISFRLDTNHDADFSNDEFYGYSLLDVGSGTNLPSFVDRDGNPVTFATNTQHLILWKQVAGVKTVLEQIPAPAAILTGANFENPTTLIVRVQEQYDASNNRENLITAYYADADTYGYGTINWDYSDFELVQWSGCTPTNDCSAAGDCSCIVDSTLTSANFNTRLPDEIGLHAVGGTDYSKAELRDLAIRFNFNAGEPTRY